MDPFEKAAQGVAGGFDDAAARVVSDQSSGLRNTLYDALLSNPDVSARATKLGRQTGMAPDLVERNLPEMERNTRLDQLDALPKQNPVLAAWLADPVNARLAHDDIDTLDLISKSALLRTPAVPKLSESYGFSQASRDLRANQQRSETAVGQYVRRNLPASEIFGRERTTTEGITEPFMRGLARGRRGITLLMGMGGMYEGDDAGLAVRLAQQNRQAEAYPIPDNVQAGHQAISEAEGFGDAAWAILTHPGAVKETVIESMGISAPSLVGAAGLSVLGPGGTAAGAGLGSFAVEYGATIQDVIAENGVNASDPLAIHAALNDPDIMAAAREKALARGVPIAMFDALTAGFAGKLLAGAKNTTGSAASRTAGELGIQGAGGGAGEATAQFMTDEFKPGEILLEAIAELPTGLIEIPANYRHARDKAQRVEQQTQGIEELNNLAKASRAATRDPETFQTLIAAAAEDGPVQQVYIDGKTLMQSGLAPALVKASPAVRDQLDRALLTGGQIAIPVDEYAARIAPTDLAPQLLDHLKTEPDGFSRAEAQEYMQNAAPELQAEVERILADKQGDDSFKASSEAVRGTIKTQLDTAARFTPQVNDAYSAMVSDFYAVTAAKLGIAPEELYQRYPLKVGAENVAGGQQFDQAETIEAVRQQWDAAGIKNSLTEKEGTITLSQIVVSEAERNTGKGTAALSALVDYADRSGQRVVLTPSSDFGGNKKRLTEFYKRFGFVENKGKNKDFSTMERMIREPKSGALAQSESGVYNQGRRNRDDYTLDLFGVPESPRADTPAEGSAAGRQDGQLSRDDAPGTYATRTELVQENTRQLGTDRVTTAAEAAQALAYLGRGAVERFDALITDQEGKPLAIVGAFKGAISQAAVYPATLTGEAFRVKGAANIWLAHNHPSGSAEFSPADRNLLRSLADVFRGSEIKLQGLFAIAGKKGDGRAWVFEPAAKPETVYTREPDEHGTTGAPVEGATVPVVERVYTDEARLGPTISSPGLAKIIAKDLAGGRSGVLLLTTQHAPVAFVPIDAAEAGMLRRDGRMDALYRALSVSNAGAVIIVNNGAMGDQAAQNLAGLFNSLDARVLDVLETSGEAVRSWQEEGKDVGVRTFAQGERGSFSPDTLAITLLKNADLSTFLHESGHFFLEVQADIAAKLQGEAKVFGFDALKPGERQILADMDALLDWFDVRGGEAVHLNAKDRVNGAELADMAQRFNMTPSALVAAWKAKPPKPNSSQGLLWSKLDGIPELALFAAENPGAVSRMGLETGTALDVWHNLTLDEKRSYHEQFARGFEAYLFEGNAPSIELQGLFQRFRAWLLNVYRDLKALNVELSDEVRGVFDRMLATNEQIQLAEQGRSMMPLFTSPEQAGMTPGEFAAYQALGVDATNEAIQDLQGRGLRDMQWLHNTRGRVIKQLKKASAARRAEVQMDARREVMSQPVYRAWDFLTRKLTDNDKLPPLERKSDPDVLDPTLDSLFVAIAKLGGIRKDQVLSEWGVDPKDMPQSGMFGKPVWRVTDGLPIDSMASALAEHGYLPLNEHGQYELNDLGDRFLEELAGNTQYSNAYQPQDLQPGEQVNNSSGLTAGRLDLGALAVMGVPDEVLNAVKARKMTAADGLHPDLAAELYGFSSGDELVRALAAAETPKAEIDALTDVRMLENYGDLSSPEAIEKAADHAIHNDVRARMVATEANALAKATGQRKVLASAAREYAAAMIARLKVRAIKPGQYANAEVRAARAAEKASKSGDLATAAAEKRNQLVNTYATRAAYDAQEEVDAGLRYLKKFDKAGKSLDPEYQDQIDAMLERFDLRRQSNKAIDRRKSLAQWIEAQREAGLEPDIDPKLENEAFRTSYKDMTVEEFRGLLDTVKQIEHLGRLKHKLLTVQDQRAFGVIVDEVAASIVENGGKARPVELETPTGIRPWLEGFAAGHRKIASLIRQMDGLMDNGPFWRVLVRGMNEAATNEAVMNEQATVALAGIYKPLLDMKGGLNGDKQFIPEINDSLTRGGRLSVALNWGNATNRARIMDGDGWSEAQVEAILRRLTRAEWNFVNSMWAYIDSHWPKIEAKEKRVTGRAPDKVKADPFSFTVDGETIQLTGGYYPIKYDSNRDDRAEKLEAADAAKDMMRGAFTRSTTRRGHTKERVEGVRRPVKKTLDVITQHVSEVTHDLAWHEWLIDANRLLNAKPINQAIREHYGIEVIRTMKDAMTGIATADIIPQTKVDTALLYLRANVSRSTMGMSLTTAFLQPFGLSQSMVRIGVKPVLRGMARWAGDAARFESSMTWISEKSDFMRLRNKTFNRELHEIKGRVSKGHSQARAIYDASLFMLMQKMQMVADVPTWIGAYEKALAADQDDATAVSLADQVVLDSQGGGQTKDMAEFQRKSPFLTMFYSYFNTTLNLAAESTAQTDFKNPLAVAGWASDMALLMVIPALAPAMLLALMRGEDCEGEDCAKKLVQAQAGYLLNLMLGIREVSGAVAGFDYAGPPVGRVVTELSRAGTQVAQGEADEALAMSSIRLLGVTLGIPTTQILRSWRGWNAWAEGDAPASSILLGPPQKE